MIKVGTSYMTPFMRRLKMLVDAGYSEEDAVLLLMKHEKANEALRDSNPGHHSPDAEGSHEQA